VRPSALVRGKITASAMTAMSTADSSNTLMRARHSVRRDGQRPQAGMPVLRIRLSAAVDDGRWRDPSGEVLAARGRRTHHHSHARAGGVSTRQRAAKMIKPDRRWRRQLLCGLLPLTI
jgi:hypothetical protein